MSTLKSNEKFQVKDFYYGFEWNRMNVTLRRRIGILLRLNL